MKTVVAGKNDAGQRLDKFLSKFFRNVPMGTIYKWIRKKRVKVNGKKQEISYSLNQGDRLDLYINDEFFEASSKPCTKVADLPVEVVYEDKNVLIARKPSGVASHGDSDSLIERIKGYLIKKGEFLPENENTFSPALCNRLDKNTSGLVIAAKNAAALRIINQKIKDREIKKYYIMRLEKPTKLPCGRIEGFTLKDEKTQKVSFSEEQRVGAKPCLTYYKSLNKDGLVEARLETGRTHQIRASFGWLGCPIVGDVKYGASKNGKNTFQQLCAYKIEFDFKSTANEMDYLNGKTIETYWKF